jgi:hypothetical protein
VTDWLDEVLAAELARIHIFAPSDEEIEMARRDELQAEEERRRESMRHGGHGARALPAD